MAEAVRASDDERGGGGFARYRDDLILVLVTLAAFLRGIPYGLHESWDDARFLIDFEPVHSIGWNHFVTIWSQPHFEAYHPLHLLSYWIDVPVFGPSGPVLHTVSLLLWVAAVLVWRRCFRSLGLGAASALVATLLFAVHPVQIEAVSWATGRKDVLAALFSGLATLAHLRSERLTDRWSLLALVAFAAAALSKTTVLPLPAVWILADGILERRAWRDAGLRQLPALALAAALGFVALGIWDEAEMVREPLSGFGRATLVAYVLGHHLGTALVPWNLSPIYPIHREAPSLAAWLAPVLFAGAMVLARKRPRVLLGLAAFAVLLLPASNIVPLYFEVQDRYLSLPLVGLAFAAGAVMDAVLARPPRSRKLATAGVVVAVYAGLTIVQLGHWRSDEALWQQAVRAEPDAFYAWMKVGELRREEGDFEGAIRAYDRAIEVQPRLALGYGARFHVVVLRDEKALDLEPSRAEAFTQQFLAVQTDELGLRRLAGTIAEAGYREAVLVPLGRALDLAPLPDQRLAHAAVVQLDSGNPWLARFYVERMEQPPPELVERLRAAE